MTTASIIASGMYYAVYFPLRLYWYIRLVFEGILTRGPVWRVRRTAISSATAWKLSWFLAYLDHDEIASFLREDSRRNHGQER